MPQKIWTMITITLTKKLISFRLRFTTPHRNKIIRKIQIFFSARDQLISERDLIAKSPRSNSRFTAVRGRNQIADSYFICIVSTLIGCILDEKLQVYTLIALRLVDWLELILSSVNLGGGQKPTRKFQVTATYARY